MSYSNMTSMPSHINATRTQAGNARDSYVRENFKMPDNAKNAMAFGTGKGDFAPGMAGGRYMEAQCQFPAPPPRRCYCHPAPFSSSCCGAGYFRLVEGYGMSRPCHSYN